MDILSNSFNFNHLSVRDLVEARDLFHVHLINKRNVVATAIGKYRVRKNAPWPNQPGYGEDIKRKKPKKEPKTLENTEVRDYSLPCILVFVSQWEELKTLIEDGEDNIVPKKIYMPDGRIVPVCIVQAPKSQLSNDDRTLPDPIFPLNLVGGGFPILLDSQGQERLASIGCVVSDGNKYYALTNKHVTGTEGMPVYTKMKGLRRQIGVCSDKQLGKLPFETAYQGWQGRNILVNLDVGLVEIENINHWKTDVFGIGQLGEPANLNTSNISLSLISTVQTQQDEVFPRVKAYGAVSGKIEGEIVALFYRYKSVGGMEYVSDFLIGGTGGKPLNIHHGDSGTLWLIEYKGEYLPFAIHWGQHNFIHRAGEEFYPYGLATNLSNACLHLDVDLVRGWNLDQDYSWGKTGHYKVAAKSCELVSDKKLFNFLMKNQRNIGYTDASLIDEAVVSGSFTDSRDLFVPLADVADIIWRSKRKKDSTNHFADMDESHPDVHGGKSLLELCLEDAARIEPSFWIDYFKQLDAAKPSPEGPRDVGALPFRVWQMYNQMVESLKQGKLEEFICAGGTMAHYVGDACQPLHISFLHHGRDASEEEVHSVYETDMVDKKKDLLFEGINNSAKKVEKSDLVTTGAEAARRVLELMHFAFHNLPPVEVLDSYVRHEGNRKRLDLMWEDLGERTIVNMAEGCRVLAILWESAWKAGNGNKIAAKKLVEMDQNALKALYDNNAFVTSYRIKDPELKALLV